MDVPVPITGLVRTAALIIGPDGGEIRIGRYRLEVPSGALALPILITVSDLSELRGRLQCELLPHGLNFSKPVRLKAELPEGVAPDDMKMYWITNPDVVGEKWLPMLSWAGEDGRSIEALLNHFSMYAPGTLEGKAGWRELQGRPENRPAAGR